MPEPEMKPFRAKRPALNSIGFPYPPYLWRVVRLSALIWLSGRALIGLALSWAAGTSAALQPSFSTHLFLAAATAVLVWWDRRRSEELLLPANLGTSPAWFWAASLLTAGTLDVVLQALLTAR